MSAHLHPDLELRDLARQRVAASSVKSAVRVLEILELFCACRTPLGVGEVAKTLGYPQSSTSMLLHSLQMMGYLVFDKKTRTFVPTVRLPILGGWMNDVPFASGSISRMLEDIRARTQETVVLGIQNSIYVQYAHVLLGDTQPKNYLRIGQLRPIGHASLGKMLLSLKPDKEIALIVRRMNATLKERVSLANLMVEIAGIRRSGYARSRGSVIPGRDVLAVRLPQQIAGTDVVLGISGETERHDQCLDSLLGVLRACSSIGTEPEVAHAATARSNRWHPE